LIRRALQVLADREATPQLGLLKSTLLQLDSTFSEREYGAGSFRDFMEKVAQSGAVTLREAGRNVLVEAKADAITDRMAVDRVVAGRIADAPVAAAASEPENGDEETLPPSPMTIQDGIRAVQTAFGGPTPPRWPMYVRQAKQYLRTAIEGFDEKNYGFASVVDLLRAAGKEGVVRIERDRQGAVRVFGGPKLAAVSTPPLHAQPVSDLPIVDVELTVADVVEPAVVEATVVDTPPKPTRRRKASKPKGDGDAPKPKRTATRTRKAVRTKDAAADPL
jgi:hypothetical protein